MADTIIGPSSRVQSRAQRRWRANIWMGCNLRSWLSIIASRWKQVADNRENILLVSAFAAILNTLLGTLQTVCCTPLIRMMKPDHDPLFIIGHWRSGTTVLHHLLSLDPQFTYANNYVCFAPHHFLITEWLLRGGFDWLAPLTRPMDDFPLLSGEPQEHEFALMALNAPSPYRTLAFPSPFVEFLQQLEHENGDAAERLRWQKTMDWLVRALTLREHKRLLLKSPADSFRVSRILDMYPNAQFICLIRAPCATIASSCHMWRALFETQALGGWSEQDLEDCVIDTFQAWQLAIGAARHKCPPSQFHEIHFEQLQENPCREMTALYEMLALGEFNVTQLATLHVLQSIKNHEPACYELSESARQRLKMICP